MINIYIKTFQELSANLLYNILQLRSEVFVVEQNCIYQDIDEKDEKAMHIIGVKNDKVIAYSRIFKPGDYFDKASIGRVVVKKNERHFGYGHDLMKASIKAIEDKFGEKTIKISAQKHLKKFYESHNFLQEGTEYLEDGIPHICMVKSDQLT